MSEPLHEAGVTGPLPSQTTVAQNLGQTTSVNPDLLRSDTEPPEGAAVPVEPVNAVTEPVDNTAEWEGIPTEGWTVRTLKGLLIDATTYGVGTVLDPSVVTANFTPWTMQKLVNAGVITHSSATSPVPADPWSVLGLRSAGTGDTAGGTDGEGSALDERHEGGQAEDGEPVEEHHEAAAVSDTAPPTVLNPNPLPASVDGGAGPVQAASIAEAEPDEFDPAAMSVADVKRLVEQHPDLRDDVLHAELVGRNRSTLVTWLQEQEA